jgi:hypothetical protein
LTLTDSGRTPPVVVNAKGVEERSKGNGKAAVGQDGQERDEVLEHTGCV